jgi:hypothetical protein
MDQKTYIEIESRKKDIKTFESVIKLLPEEETQKFIEQLKYDALYTKMHTLNKFYGLAETKGWNFFNDQVQDYFINLKQSLRDLDNFLQSHFFVKKYLHSNPIFVLYPELKGNEEITEIETAPGKYKKISKYKLWKQRKKELDVLINQFDHFYNVFITLSPKILLKETTPKKISRKILPTLRNINGFEYIILPKRKPIPLAKPSTKQTKLFKCLINTFGIPTKLDVVFDSISTEKDGRKQKLYDGHTRDKEQARLIKMTIKVLQKILRRHDVNFFNFRVKDKFVWIEWGKK